MTVLPPISDDDVIPPFSPPIQIPDERYELHKITTEEKIECKKECKYDPCTCCYQTIEKCVPVIYEYHEILELDGPLNRRTVPPPEPVYVVPLAPPPAVGIIQ